MCVRNRDGVLLQCSDSGKPHQHLKTSSIQLHLHTTSPNSHPVVPTPSIPALPALLRIIPTGHPSVTRQATQSSIHQSTPTIRGSQLSSRRTKCAPRASYLERFYIQRRRAVHDREVKCCKSVTKIEVTQAKRRRGKEIKTGDQKKNKNKKSWNAL